MQSFRLPFLCLGLLFNLPASALTWGELDNELIAVVKEEAQRSDAKRSATVQSLILAGLREKFPC